MNLQNVQPLHCYCTARNKFTRVCACISMYSHPLAKIPLMPGPTEDELKKKLGLKKVTCVVSKLRFVIARFAFLYVAFSRRSTAALGLYWQ